MTSLPDNSDVKKVVVGLINGIYGIQGEVKVYSYTRPREQIFHYKTWYLKKDNGCLECSAAQGRNRSKGLTARIEGISDRDQAQEIMSTEIAVAVDLLPELPDGEYYWHQLIGLKVQTVDGQLLGTISDIEETGANDVLVLEGDDRLLIPYVRGSIVNSIDLDAGMMQVDWNPDYI